MDAQQKHLLKDFGIIIGGIVAAILLLQTGALESILTSTRETRIIGSLVAGVLFCFYFSAAPATAVLIEIAQAGSPLEVALAGAVGAVLGDLMIFRFIKDTLREDIFFLLHSVHSDRLKSVFRTRPLRVLAPAVGAVIVASPFPDELGLALMGLSKMSSSHFIPLSFALNFCGILTIGLLAKAL